MNRYRLSDYFERGRGTEGMRAEEVERVIARYDDLTSGAGTGETRWRIVLPLVLVLLLGCGSVIVAVRLGNGGGVDRSREVATQETEKSGTSQLGLQKDKLLPDKPTRDNSDISRTLWGYRLKAGDRLRYERSTLWDDIDWKERKEYVEWADITVERIGPGKELTLHVVITHGDGDTGMVCRVILSPMGEIRSSDMLYDPEHKAFLENIMRPSFGGGGRVLPSVAAAREIEKWLPVWRQGADFEDGGEFLTRETRYDTAWSGTTPDYDNPDIHGDTVGNMVYYSSARSRGITEDGTQEPSRKWLRPGTSESSISMVPIITSGEDTAEVVRSVQFIDTTTETHHYVLLTSTDAPTGKIAWSDASRAVCAGRSAWKLNDTLVFRSSDGAILKWSSVGRSTGNPGQNVKFERHIRLIQSVPANRAAVQPGSIR